MSICRNITSLLLVSVAACSTGSSSDPSTSTDESSLRGAEFTTNIDGTCVDCNIYTSKDDVYLNGGPLKKASAAALPDGDYYFQVTDPSGKLVLSEDDISCREVRFFGGLIVEVFRGTSGTGGCMHRTGVDATDGGLTVQLMPYADTPNPGGEYKAWITPIERYNGRFLPRYSKMDNFKVKSKMMPPPPTPDAGTPPPTPDAGICDAPPPPPTPDAAVCDAPPPPPDCSGSGSGTAM